MVVGGYCRLLQAMAARVDVRLASPVTLIEDLDNDTVRVTTAAGACFSLLPSVSYLPCISEPLLLSDFHFMVLSCQHIQAARM